MSGILKGLRGEEWEQALLITRPRARGMPRVVDEPENLALILVNRNRDIPRSSLDAVRDWLREEYNLSASKRSVTAALKLLRDEENQRIINKIIKQCVQEPLPNTVSILSLLNDELSWVKASTRTWIVAEALDRLGYVRRRWENEALWSKSVVP